MNRISKWFLPTLVGIQLCVTMAFVTSAYGGCGCAQGIGVCGPGIACTLFSPGVAECSNGLLSQSEEVNAPFVYGNSIVGEGNGTHGDDPAVVCLQYYFYSDTSCSIQVCEIDISTGGCIHIAEGC